MNHPFLSQDLPIRWSTLTATSVQEDIKLAIEQAQVALDEVISQDRGRMNFESVILAQDEALRPLNQAWGLVTHLDALVNTPELREAHNAMLPEVSAFFSKIPLDPNLWDLVLTYSQTDEAKALDGVQKRALDETLAYFRQYGAELSDEKKKRFEEVQNELSLHTQKYSENVLDSTNAWELILEDTSRLDGLPDSAIAAAQQDAAAKGHGDADNPKYRFTLKAPSMLPVLEYAHDSELRKTVWEASTKIGRGGDFDNTELIWKILKLRHEKATLLGKKNFGDYILERRMAKNGATALAFVEDLYRKVKPSFEREVIDLQEYVADHLSQEVRLLEPWEIGYMSEKRRREQYDFDEEQLRPYFPIQGVLEGMFALAERLFEIRITEKETVFLLAGEENVTGAVEVWHPEVKYFEVRNADGTLTGTFYADWHPRDSKRSGAWMNYLVGGEPPKGDQPRRVHVGLICGNMSPPVGGKPALLTHDEVCTVFHEFGHLLHQLLGTVEIPSLNGVNVAWDFVELPSQLMENFCWERESLDFFAKHHETGEPISDKLYKKMIAARNYMSAVGTMRQVSFGKLDLELHLHHATDENTDIDELSRKILADYKFPTQTEAPTMARRFGHLFSSPTGYAASYYSYKWAEVLDADAFTRFQHEGVLNPKVGRELRDKILSRGNSVDPAKLFEDFMGRKADPNALLRRAGLL